MIIFLTITFLLGLLLARIINITQPRTFSVTPLSLWVFFNTLDTQHMFLNTLFGLDLLGALLTFGLGKFLQPTVHTISSIGQWLYSTDHKNIKTMYFIRGSLRRILGIVKFVYTQVAAKQSRTQLINYTVSIISFHENGSTVNIHLIVLVMFWCWTLWWALTTAFYMAQTYAYGDETRPFKLFGYLHFCLFAFSKYLFSPTYYVTACFIISYTLVDLLGVTGQLYFISFTGFYFTFFSLRRLIFELIACTYLGLIAMKRPLFVFLGLRLKWMCDYAEFNFFTSGAIFSLVNLCLFDLTVTRFGWQMILAWVASGVFPGLWGRFILAIIYPMIRVFPQSFPLFFYRAFSGLVRYKILLIVTVLFAFSLLLYVVSFVDLWWLRWVQKVLIFVFFSYRSIYSVITLYNPKQESKKIIPFIDRDFFTAEFFDFTTSSRVPIPLTREAAIVSLQYPLIVLLGVKAWTFSYGNLIYCRSNFHKHWRAYTLYQQFFWHSGFYLKTTGELIKEFNNRITKLKKFTNKLNLVHDVFRAYTIILLDEWTIHRLKEHWLEISIGRYTLFYGLSYLLFGLVIMNLN